jgi:hypothetical protein
MESIKLDTKKIYCFEQLIDSLVSSELFSTTLEQLGLGIFYSNAAKDIFFKNSIFSSLSTEEENEDTIVKKIAINANSLLILGYKNPRKKAHTIRNALACLEGVHYLLQKQDPQAFKALLDAFEKNIQIIKNEL